MRKSNVIARMCRAVSGKTQRRFAEDTGVDPSLLSQIELGYAQPRGNELDCMTHDIGVTVADAEELLQRLEELRQGRRRREQGLEELVPNLTARLGANLANTYERLMALPRPERSPQAEDRVEAEEQWALLQELPEGEQRAAVQVAEELHTWALCERMCEESVRQLSRNLPLATTMAQLAQEIGERVQGPESWRRRVRGYAAAHVANAMRVSGELEAARAALLQAGLLWESGSDPAGVLDPGRLLHFEAALCRDQRRFDEALALLDEAATISHRGRALVNKGFTFEVMGEYQRAVEALLQAMPLIDRQAEPRQWNVLRFNLANVFCHLQRHREALELVEELRTLIAEQGDEIDLIRIGWLEGRIAAGLGQPEEALRLFAEARREFAARGMSYDVALALLEEAVLLLEEGRTAEVKALAEELVEVFEAKGVHREALAALRLFHEAAEREAATAALARRVLHYLYQARHDQGLPFSLP